MLQLLNRHKSYVVTLAFEFAILLLSFLVYRIANQSMNEYGFSEYTLSRRSISLLQPLLMIGLGVAVPRYVSLYPKRNSIFISASFLLLTAAILLGVVLLIGQSYFAELFFGDPSYSSYIFPLFLLLSGYCFHALVFGFLRGKHFVYFPNVIQFINIGALPILVILYTSDVSQILYINGLVLLINSGLTLTYLWATKNIIYSAKRFKADIKTLLKYGLPRVLGDFSLLLLITAPTYLVLYIQDDLLISGDVAYSLTLLNLVGAAFGPLGLVLLPEISQFMNLKNHAAIMQRFKVFIVLSLSLTLAGYFIFLFFSDFILNILLGEGYRESISSIAILILQASFGYALYIVLRSFLDAIKVRATNSFNLMISLGLYAILVGYNYLNDASVDNYLHSFVISISFLGLITLVQTLKAIQKLKQTFKS